MPNDHVATTAAIFLNLKGIYPTVINAQTYSPVVKPVIISAFAAKFFSFLTSYNCPVTTIIIAGVTFHFLKPAIIWSAGADITSHFIT